MKRANSNLTKVEISEPDSERKIKKINLELERCEFNRAPKFLSKNSTRELVTSQDRKHKKAISSIDLLSFNGVLKKKLIFNSTKNSKNNLELKDSNRPVLHPSSLIFPEKIQIPPINEEVKLMKLKQKFKDFKKSFSTQTKKTRVYNKNFHKTNSFLVSQKSKLFSKGIMTRVIFNAWKEVVRKRLLRSVPPKPKNK